MLTLLLALPVGAQEIPELRRDPPKEVQFGIFIVDLRKIDDTSQSVSIDFAVAMRWSDPTLRSSEGPPRVISFHDAWHPDLQIVNELNLDRRRPEVLEVESDGSVIYRQRFSGTLTAPLDFSDFPFDKHVLKIEMVSPLHSPDDLHFVMLPERIGQSKTFSIADWEVGKGAPRARSFQLLAEPFAGVVYEIEVRRKLGFYLWNVILPLMLVVFMSWTVFWIDPVHTGPQISVAITANLTLIAYRFSLGFLVPRLSYLTKLDRFLVGASVLVFAALCEVILTGSLAGKGQEERARAIDRASRWVFPLLLAAVLVGAIAY